MRRFYRQTLFVMCLAAACTPGRGAALFLSPSDNLTGDAGSVVGWGFGFANTDWSVLTFSEFLSQGAPAGVLGSYGDFISLPQNFYDQQPDLPLIVGFDPSSDSGIGEFAISPDIAAGTVIAGTIRLHFDTYLGDPEVGAPTLALDNTVDVPVTITVTGAAAEAPEPGFRSLLGFCLLLGLAAARGKPMWIFRARR